MSTRAIVATAVLTEFEFMAHASSLGFLQGTLQLCLSSGNPEIGSVVVTKAILLKTPQAQGSQRPPTGCYF
jgi:hypothetical protein